MPRPPPRRRAHGPSSGSGHRPWLQQSQQPPTTSWAQVSSALEVGAAFLHEPVVVSGWVISGTVVGLVVSVSVVVRFFFRSWPRIFGLFIGKTPPVVSLARIFGEGLLKIRRANVGSYRACRRAK
jgi:hypothetical protein